MVRTKHVVKTEMVAHLWAHRSQDSARNPHGNFYFQGDTIFSYSYHFPIAKHVKNKRGESAVLLTIETRSNATTNHTQCVAGACRHLTVFHVSDVEKTDKRILFDEYRARFVELGRRYVKARSRKPEILTAMGELAAEANAFAEFFGFRCRIRPVKNEGWKAECVAIEKRESAKYKRQIAENAKQHAENIREAIERLEEWTAGKSVYPPVNGPYWHNLPTRLRINGGTLETSVYGPYWLNLPTRLRINGGTLETSLGAEVPLNHAIKAFRLLKKLHDKGQIYQRNGHTIHLGNFAINSMDAQGNVRAGCHNIEWSEIERVATLAGVN